jgi:hypothetical protein
LYVEIAEECGVYWWTVKKYLGNGRRVARGESQGHGVRAVLALRWGLLAERRRPFGEDDDGG